MISLREMQDALINKFKNDVSKRIKGYEKKVRTQVIAITEAEYKTIVLGEKPKVKKVKEEKKSFSFDKG